MRYRVYTKRLYYEIELNGKYTVLNGDSGKGKSVLYSLIYDKSAGDKSVHIDMLDKNGIWKPSDTQFFAVMPNDSNLVLNQDNEGSVFVIDENASIFKQSNAATIFRQSRHQFLLITRKNIDYLPVSVENIFHLKNEGKKHFFEHEYKIEYKKNFGMQDIIITEDSNSGYKIFLEFFKNIPVRPAYSKSKIVKVISNLDKKYRNILVVYDASAFGMQMKKFKEVLEKEKRNISVLDWYSFEHHILAQPPFNNWINPQLLDYTSESLEQYATEQLSRIIKYSKHKDSIKPCLVKQSLCNTCDRINVCKYVHSQFDLGIKIMFSKPVLK